MVKELAEFQLDMANKLHENEYKGGWKHMGETSLLERLKEEMDELEDSIKEDYHKDQIIGECADIANFCMMIADQARNNRI